MLGADADAPHVEPDEMGRQENHRLPRDGLPVLDAQDLHQPMHPLLRRPPQDAMLEEAAAERPKVRFHYVAPLLLAPLRKAKPDVSECYLTALAPQ
ncbi:hypothetical protein D3C83_17080 [compost metagenome]